MGFTMILGISEFARLPSAAGKPAESTAAPKGENFEAVLDPAAAAPEEPAADALEEEAPPEAEATAGDETAAPDDALVVLPDPQPAEAPVIPDAVPVLAPKADAVLAPTEADPVQIQTEPAVSRPIQVVMPATAELPATVDKLATLPPPAEAQADLPAPDNPVDRVPAAGAAPSNPRPEPTEAVRPPDVTPESAPEMPSETKPASVENADPIKADITLHLSRDLRIEVPTDMANRPRIVHPHEVTRQIAEKVAASDQNRIEITLTPEELGKIRLVITPGESPEVSVYSDNRETLDLLRRNADLLQKELRDTGFGGASLSFGEENRGKAPASFTHGRFGTAAEPGSSPAPVMPPPPAADRRLDIRI